MSKRRPDTLIAIAAAVAIVQSSPARSIARKSLVDDLLRRGLVRSRAGGYRVIRAAVEDARLWPAGESIICHYRRARTRAAIAAAVSFVRASPARARDGITAAALRKSLVLDLQSAGIVGSRSAGYRVLQAAVADSRLRVDADLFALLRLP